MENRSSYVQFGCAWSAPKSWRNFDASPTLRFERIPVIGQLYVKNDKRFPSNVEYGDITKGLPVCDESCDAVYSSHVLEHLSLHDFRIALRNIHKILKQGGICRMVLPDLGYLVDEYRKSFETSDAPAINFMMNTGLGCENRKRGLAGLLISLYGNSHHLWMWDYKSLAHEIKAAGFQGIRKAEFGDSSVMKFHEVEDKSRWENCLGVECYK